MSLLGLLNFILLQWFFIRLGRIVEINEIDIDYVTVNGVGGNVRQKTVGYKILKWIVPLTGWWSDYIFVKKKRK